MIDTYNALVTKLLSLTLTDITSDDIAWDNDGFNPTGKDAWLSVFYMPATMGTSTKDGVAIAERGLLQVTVNVPSGSVEGSTVQYNTKALAIAKEILTGFASGTLCEYNNQGVQILDSGLASPINGGGWYQIPISINYVRI
jgi:hypothetical protein